MPANATQSSTMVQANGRRPKLDLIEDQDTKIINILNVCMHKIDSLEEASERYKYGIMQRKTSGTKMND